MVTDKKKERREAKRQRNYCFPKIQGNLIIWIKIVVRGTCFRKLDSLQGFICQQIHSRVAGLGGKGFKQEKKSPRCWETPGHTSTWKLRLSCERNETREASDFQKNARRCYEMTFTGLWDVPASFPLLKSCRSTRRNDETRKRLLTVFSLTASFLFCPTLVSGRSQFTVSRGNNISSRHSHAEFPLGTEM